MSTKIKQDSKDARMQDGEFFIGPSGPDIRIKIFSSAGFSLDIIQKIWPETLGHRIGKFLIVPRFPWDLRVLRSKLIRMGQFLGLEPHNCVTKLEYNWMTIIYSVNSCKKAYFKKS